MANIKSQKKRNLQNEKRRVRNLAVRSELKTRIKGAQTAAETGREDAAERLVARAEAPRQGRRRRASSTRTRPPAARRA